MPRPAFHARDEIGHRVGSDIKAGNVKADDGVAEGRDVGPGYNPEWVEHVDVAFVACDGGIAFCGSGGLQVLCLSSCWSSLLIYLQIITTYKSYSHRVTLLFTPQTLLFTPLICTHPYTSILFQNTNLKTHSLHSVPPTSQLLI